MDTTDISKVPSPTHRFRLKDEGLCLICSAPFEYRGSRKSVWEGESVHDFVNQYEETDQYPELQKLGARAQAGCKLCGFIRSVILDNTQSWFDRVAQSEERCEIHLKWPMIALEIQNQNTSDELSFNGAAITGTGALTIEEFPERITRLLPYTLPLVHIRLSVLLNQDLKEFHVNESLNIHNLNMIQSFLNECSSQHHACSNTLQTYTPTRLIDVSNGTNTIRLVERPGLGSHLTYAALSYCWGKPRVNSESYKTTASNFQSRLSGFHLSEQPPTIQDAVKTTRALGIKYLWIDALCILQGDKVDWQREGLNMDKVYENAYITIASTATDTVWQSFLDRPIIQTQLSLATDSNVGSTSVGFHYPFNTEMSDMELTLPWWQRAWTLQEHSLSTRILYFTREILYLECLSDRKIESIQYHIPDSPSCKPWRQNLRNDPGHDFGEDLSYAMTTHQKWYEVVEQYSSRKLSFEEDKLIAIAGLVNHISKQLPNPDRYSFGLFENDLCHGLLWTTRRSDLHPSPSERTSSMPSWSWASYPGPVSYSQVARTGMDSAIQHISSSSEGRLTLLATIIEATEFFPDEEILPAQSWGNATNSSYSAWQFLHDFRRELKAKELLAILINHSSWYTYPKIRGLLIENAKDGTGKVLPETYQRVGYFHVSCKSVDNRPCNLYKSLKPQEVTLV